jgi:hypothetical protein
MEFQELYSLFDYTQFAKKNTPWQLCVVLTANSHKKSKKSHTKPIKMQIFLSFIGFVCDFIDFLCEFTVKTTEHAVVSYESSDFT